MTWLDINTTQLWKLHRYTTLALDDRKITSKQPQIAFIIVNLVTIANTATKAQNLHTVFGAKDSRKQ
jgi:hypothetical protein